MSELEHLFSPIKIGNVEIRNRILQSAHITNFAEDGLPSERHLRYYEARAKGGIGLIIQEATVVNPYTGLHPTLSHGWKGGWSTGFARSGRPCTPTGPSCSCNSPTEASWPVPTSTS